MLYYFDSSAAIKRYAAERGSEWVRSIVEPSAENTIYLAQIGVIEIAAALSRKVRSDELTREDYEAALYLFLADVRNEEYIIAPLSDQVVELAVDLTRRHPLRGYDATHLATAIILNTTLQEAELPSLIFVSADEALCEAARDEALPANNPNEY
ncbi:MAG: type II toxin-antitoxin system VapC family toxin [Chloroflexi bacterium]|nr:type II toxin-antitoxin system VapC family toxin [Chloroflexota bacterium]